MNLQEKIIELLKITATQMPTDIVDALKKAQKKENNKTSKEILEKILENIKKAKDESLPICQDTGTPFFYVDCPRKYSQTEIRKTIKEALKIATTQIPLRPNAVDSLSGKNIGNLPIIHFKEASKLKINLILKGGGSENVSMIYKLPDIKINAHRNLDGVRKCILDTVFNAQGKGCPPYIVGVAIAGSYEEAAHLSKKQLFRKINNKNEIKELEKLEEKSLKELNSLSIGPLGLGGKTTALSVKIVSSTRHPASYFVGVSIGCWALRRHTLKI